MLNERSEIISGVPMSIHDLSDGIVSEFTWNSLRKTSMNSLDMSLD